MTWTLEEVLGKDAIEALRRPIEHARGLPTAAYTSEEFFKLEQERLFPRTWTGVAFTHQIPEPGDAIPVTVAGLPIIVLRDKKGEIRAFHNVCRHRATLVLREPAKGLSNLQCPYHAWTYGLDGKLKATPYWDGTKNARDSGVEKSKNGLVPVRSGVWYDFIYVNLEGNAPPLEEYIRPAEELLADYDLDSLNSGHREYWEFDANWKLLADNWENYHSVWVHKRLIELKKQEGGTTEKITNEYFDMPAEGCCAGLVSREEKTKRTPMLDFDLPHIPGSWPSKCIRTLLHIFPNTTVAMQPSYMAPAIYTPLAPGRTQANMAWCFVGEAASNPDFAERREALLDQWLGESRSPTALDGIRNQDYGIMAVQQIARASHVADDVQFSPYWEGHVHRFQNMVIDALV